MSKEKFNKKVLYSISLIIDMFSFVKIDEIQIPEPFTDLSQLWEVLKHKKLWVNFYYSLRKKKKKKTRREMPGNILFLTKSLQDVILTVLTGRKSIANYVRYSNIVKSWCPSCNTLIPSLSPHTETSWENYWERRCPWCPQNYRNYVFSLDYLVNELGFRMMFHMCSAGTYCERMWLLDQEGWRCSPWAGL